MMSFYQITYNSFSVKSPEVMEIVNKLEEISPCDVEDILESIILSGVMDYCSDAVKDAKYDYKLMKKLLRMAEKLNETSSDEETD